MRSQFWERGAHLGLAALAATWRYEIVGRDHCTAARASGAPVVWTHWHGDLLPLLWLHRHQRLAVLISRHRDGERIVGLARQWGYRPLRGSSTRGAVAGLLALARTLEGGGHVALAVDGPRGPRHVAKSGAVAVAQHGRAAIVAVAAAAVPAWSLTSWDGFLVPAPWARIRVAYAPPWRVGSSAAGADGRDPRPLQERLEWATRQAAG